MKHLCLTFLSFVFALITYGKNFPTLVGDHSSAKALTGKHAPLSFIENKGQVTDQGHKPRNDIQFRVAATPGLNIFIGAGAIHYQLSKCNAAESKMQTSNSKIQNFKTQIPNSTCEMYRMDVALIGANKTAQVITEEKQDYYENYFTENTGGHSVTAYTYNRITYKDIYPHIDWVLYMTNGQLEHEFVINDCGKVEDIQLKYGGATDLKLNTDGGLAANTPQGMITEQAPKSYEQDGKVVKSNFKLDGDILSYETGSYSGKLVIDPALVWATYFGGWNWDWGQGVTTDDSDNVYITGYTTSTSGVATSGAYEVILSATGSAFLAKFSGAGYIQWATYYGEGSSGEGTSIATDDSGNVYITGYTGSTSGIATPGAYKDTLSGGDLDCFLAKFNSTGFIQWGTYFGGIGAEWGKGMAVDSAGNVYITGQTNSNSGIATPGAYQTIYADSSDAGDAFLAKFNGAGSIQWATYFGGIGNDEGFEVATDGLGNVYIAGITSSVSSIATSGAYQTFYGGGHSDAFLTKFNGDGTIQWATYYGGGGDDGGSGIASDDSGNVYITGQTNSTSGIATPSAYQYSCGGFSDAFLAKFNHAGTIQWATYYGGSGGDAGAGIVTDGAQNVYITGYTGSLSGIATPGGYQTSLSAMGDAFLAKFNNTGIILWGSYYGGDGGNQGNGVAAAGSGNIYIVGTTRSISDIATPGAYQTIYGGGLYDAFFAKFFICDQPSPGPLTGRDTVTIDSVVMLGELLPGGMWSTTDSSIAIVSAGMVMGLTAGIDTIIYSISNDCGNVIVRKIIYVMDITTKINNLLQPTQNITLYPNPTQNELTITSSNPIASVTITNLLGQVVQSETCNAEHVLINVADLPTGIYLVRINDSEVRKLIKQ